MRRAAWRPRGARSRAGFAVAQTNTGHDAAVEPLGALRRSPQKFLDYAYRAVHVTALDREEDCLQRTTPARCGVRTSTAVRPADARGLISAQRFPDDFDGIVVGAPVLNFSGTMISYVSQPARARGGADRAPRS